MVTGASCSAGSCSDPRSSTRASTRRISSPTRNCRWLGSCGAASRPIMAQIPWRRPPASRARSAGRRLPHRVEGPGELLQLEALDAVALADVVVVLEGHAALVALAHLADLVLEALERLERSLVANHGLPPPPDRPPHTEQ